MTALETLLAAPRPERLFHYTDAVGIHGILSSGAIWATMLHYLNDAREFKHGLHWAKYEINQAATHQESAPRVELLSHLAESLDRIEGLNICVFSLSEARDLLSQWRSYCPEGGGYALGFNSQVLASRAAPAGFSLVKCVYDVTVQREIVRDILNEILPPHLAQVDAGQPKTEAVEPLLTAFQNHFALPAAVFKDPSFSEEQEWRLVSTFLADKNPNLSVRPRRGMLVPYYALDVRGTPGLFGPMTLGPNPHQDLACRALLLLLARLGIDDWQGVGNSQIPYRPL